jgi:hypothetical protein
MRARTRSRMLALVRQWETSGETRRAFADRHGVTQSCFDCWRRQVREACPDTSGGFARVRVIADDVPADAGVIEVVHAHSERVVIRAGASGELVRQVAAALRASC